MRILLVEDNPVNQAAAVAMLSALGCEVWAACNGAEALEMLERAEFGLVLMDCQMPVMDGLEATRHIRERETSRGNAASRVPIVALTADVSSNDRQACLAVGMDDYLTKPFTKKQLGDVVEKWAGHIPPAPTAALQGDRPQEGGGNDLPTLDVRVLRAMHAPEGPGDGELGPRLAAILVDSTQRLCREISDAARAADTDGLVAAAHSLKSSAAQVGALRLARLATDLEHAARGETGWSEAANFVLGEFEDVREALAAAELIVPRR